MSANRFRGEYPLKVGEKTYTLRYGVNAMITLSETLGCKTILELAQRLSPSLLGFREVRTLLKAALERNHPEVTEPEAGDLIDEMGGVTVVLEQISGAMQAAFPDPAEGSGGGDPNAQRAAGSGDAS